MTVFITFQTAAMETQYNNVKDVYTKDGLLCLSFEQEILKFPLCNIFCIRHGYN